MDTHHALSLTVLVLLLILAVPALSHAQMPFGGLVVFTLPCNNGFLLTVLQFTGPQFFMWNFGELPYLMFIPPHPGQNVLGMALPAPVPCILGLHPQGFGFPIIFHGESN